MGTIRWKRPGAALATIALAMTMVIGTAGTASARDNRARTTTTLAASPTSSSAGQPVTLTATVAFSGTWRSPGGRVYFGATNGTRPGTVFLGSAPLTDCSSATKTCKAVLTTSNLPVGNDLVGAAYSGDNRYQPSAGATRVMVSAAASGPPTLTSAQASDGQVALEWSAPTSGSPPTSYNIYRSTSPGGSGAPLATGITTLSYTDPTATNDTLWYYRVTAVNGSTESGPSNELSAHPPASASENCSAANPCDTGTVSSPDGQTTLRVVADPSTGAQTLEAQVGGFPSMLCTTAGTTPIISGYHTTAPDADKTADYTLHGADAVAAHDFYASHTDTTGCYGAEEVWNGWSPDPGTEFSSWETGPWVYGPVPFNEANGLYEGWLASCANHGDPNPNPPPATIVHKPCFTAISDGFNTPGSPEYFFTIQVQSPGSPTDPRIGY